MNCQHCHKPVDRCTCMGGPTYPVLRLTPLGNALLDALSHREAQPSVLPLAREAPSPHADGTLARIIDDTVRWISRYTSIPCTLQLLEIWLQESEGIIHSINSEEIGNVWGRARLKGRRAPQDLHTLTLREYIELMLDIDMFTGVCGDTSEFFERVITINHQSAQRALVPAKGFGSALKARVSSEGRWYCRAGRRPHSFLIEGLRGEVRVYQSYFGAYMLSTCITQYLKPFGFDEFFVLLDKAMAGDAPSIASLFHHNLNTGWGEATVDCSLVQFTAPPADSVRFLTRAVTDKFQSVWGSKLNRKMSELAPKPAAEGFIPATVIKVDKDDVDMRFAIPAELEANIQAMTLPQDRTYKCEDYPKHTVMYRIVAVRGTEYEFRRV